MFLSPETKSLESLRTKRIHTQLAESKMLSKMRSALTGRCHRVLQSKAMTTAAETVERYPGSLQVMHWSMGFTMLGCVGTVLAAQRVKGKTKGNLMFVHKSLGLLAGILLAPRLITRLTNAAKIPAHVPGAQWEVMASRVTHAALYGFTIVMPLTGIAMGYFGGKGLPFFFTTIPGAEEANGAVAKQAFKIHKQAGQFFEYIVPVHVGAVAFQYAWKGRNILPRMISYWK